ncbi:serine hydrolase [Roseomonas sp. CAU 1739]|uniref:serine hydrolase n=1 Tax=Roseomonas sp. CAU 1739 TaxID=3140364 RepID=UPI00325A7280
MRRRHLPAVLTAAVAPAALAQTLVTDAALDAAAGALTGLPGETALLLEAEGPKGRIRVAHREGAPVFVGSVIKTFILAAYLKAVEDGRLSLSEPLPVDDDVRSPVSPVFGALTGTAPAVVALEAMITHSDNTGTDMAIRRVTPAAVRALIAARGLAGTRIPDSTRIMVSALAGAPPGVDLGWAGIQALDRGAPMPSPRTPINDVSTMVSTGLDMIAWYDFVLAGRFFAKPETLATFKRIQSMATAMPEVAPPDVIAYGKGGSITWNGAQAMAVAGQMVAGPVRATFFYGVNWVGDDASMPRVAAAAVEQFRIVLTRTLAVLG